MWFLDKMWSFQINLNLYMLLVLKSIEGKSACCRVPAGRNCTNNSSGTVISAFLYQCPQAANNRAKLCCAWIILNQLLSAEKTSLAGISTHGYHWILSIIHFHALADFFLFSDRLQKTSVYVVWKQAKYKNVL